MKNFVNVDTRFQKSINLTLDTGDMALVNRYIPTRSSVSILKQYLTNIVRGQGEHATILIGPYGKGKSHLLLVLLALLCKSKDETAEIQKKIIEADNSTKLLFMELAEVGRPFLPVIVSSFQGDLNESFIFALQEALKKTGIRDLPLPSEYSEAVRTMESWKESYPDTYQRFEKMLEERGCTASLFKERLKKQKEAALLEFKEFYPVLTSGSVFNPMVQKEALRVYEEVKARLAEYEGDGKKAFAEKFYKPKADGTQGPVVKKVKTYKKMSLGVEINKNENGMGRGIAENANGGMIRVDVFRENGKYYFVPIYIADALKKRLPNKAAMQNKPYSEWKEMKDENFLFSLYSRDLIGFKNPKGKKVKCKDGKEIVLTKEIVYYVGANINTASISCKAHDNQYEFGSFGIQSLQELKKYQVDVLGNITEVRQEKRRGFH